mmetsp:Transcript_40155/g.84349  ORF Transcript_40155/g.84349 Transcript_40155/m.84349 type:complete len:295 (+) Transcript_40155:873-1757(+)
MFLGLICVGTLLMLMGGGIYPISIDDEIASVQGCNIACMAVPWFLGCGFSCAFSALFAKTLRINKIFGAADSYNRITVTLQDVMKPFIALLSLNIALLSIWTIVNPMVWKRIQTSPISSYGACSPQNTSGFGLTPLILFGILNIVILIAANVQAFRAREISDEFSESKYIAIALASMLQAVIIGGPVAFMTYETPRVFTVIMSGFAFIVAMSLSFFMFVPKIILGRKNKKRRASSMTSESYNESGVKGIRIITGPMSLQRFRSGVAHAQYLKEEKKRLNSLKSSLQSQGFDATL